MIYLDYAATTPISKSAINVWIKTNEDYFANSSSLHEAGSHANQLIQTCKEQLASLVGVRQEHVFFTSGGTEANQLALRSLYKAHKHKGNHVITSEIEHPSVHAFFQELKEDGVDVSYVPVNAQGLIEVEDVKRLTRSDTCLASIQHVNSEIGVIQPIALLGKWFRMHGIPFHSDSVQSFGKIPLDLYSLHTDAISVASHKIHGPKGMGAVFFSKDCNWVSTVPLTTHQSGFRPGTLNTPGIVAFTQAAIDSQQSITENLQHSWQLRDLFLNKLAPLGERLVIEGATNKQQQLPSIIGLAIHGVQGQYMLLSLDRYHICISTGSACQSQKQDASPVMRAIYETEQERLRFFRISFGRMTRESDLIYTAEKIIEIVNDYQ